MTQDENHLQLLSIFHYIVAGLSALFALLPIFHLIIGILIIANPHQFGNQADAPPS